MVVGDIGWRRKTERATRSRNGEVRGVRKVGTEYVRTEADEEEVTVVSKEVETKNTKRIGTERATNNGTENSADMERKVKEEDIFDTISTGSGAEEPEAGPTVSVLKSAMN